MTDQPTPHKVNPTEVLPGEDISSASETRARVTFERPGNENKEADSAESKVIQELLLMIVEEEGSSDENLRDFKSLLRKKPFSVRATNEENKTALHYAAEHGLERATKILIEACAEVGAKDNSGCQPLHLACEEGHTNVVTSLLATGADIEAKENRGQTPLLIATDADQSGVTEILLSKEAKVNVTDSTGWSPLHNAIVRNNEALVRSLLEVDTSAIARTTNYPNLTPLHTAALYPGGRILSLLLHKLPVLNTTDEQGSNPVISALKTQDWDGRSPLLATISSQRPENVATILKALKRYPGLKADQLATIGRDGRTPLHLASADGSLDIVKMLIQDGARCDEKCKTPGAWNGWTPLHFASFYNHAKTVEFLLSQHGVEASNTAEDGKTSLHLASQAGNSIIVKRLLNKGVPVDSEDNYGATALYLACSAKPRSQKYLSGDYNTWEHQNLRGVPQGFISWARDGAHAAIVELLLQQQASPLPRPQNPISPLHWAAFWGNRIILNAILEAMKSEPLVLGSWKGSPIDRALDGKNAEVAVECILNSAVMRKANLQQNTAGTDEINKAIQNLPFELASRLIIRTLPTSRLDGAEAFRDDDAICWASCERRLDILPSLIDASYKTTNHTKRMERALKLELESLESSQESYTDRFCEKVSRILWLLITASERTRDNNKLISNASKSFEKNQINRKSNARRELGKKRLYVDVANSRTRPKSKEVLLKITVEGKDLIEKQIHDKTPQITFFEIMRDILKDPPFGQMSRIHIDQKKYSPPEVKLKHKDIVRKAEATVVGFFKAKNKSGRIRRTRPVGDVIYDGGPADTIKSAIKGLSTMAGNDSSLFDHELYNPHDHLNFTWVHLPSTNMAWMNDTVTRIMFDESYSTRKYHEIRSFFRDSWVQVPDKISPSRTMRPKAVIRQDKDESENLQESEKAYGVESNGSAESGDEGEGDSEKAEKKDQISDDKPAGRAPEITEASERRGDRRTKGSRKAVAQSAVYMPYLTYSTHYPNSAGIDVTNEFAEAISHHNLLLQNYGSDDLPQHGSPTLDEWYYQFRKDDPEASQDREERNKDQVVSKYRDKSPKEDASASVEENADPKRLTVVRVNQLWIWTIADKWIITATSSPFDESPDVLVVEILNQLAQQAEYGGSKSLPSFANDLVPVIVNHCISSYERRKRDDTPSIGQTFSHYINGIGRQETILFDEFRDPKRKKRAQLKSEKKRKESRFSIKDIFKATDKADPGRHKEHSSSDASLVSPLPKEADQAAHPFTDGQTGYEPKHDVRTTRNPISHRNPFNFAEHEKDKDTSSAMGVAKSTDRLTAITLPKEQAVTQTKSSNLTRTETKPAKDLCYDIKDVRDELSILKSVVRFQEIVQKDLAGDKPNVLRFSSTYVMEDLKELDSIAERIQTAINTTLSLQQSELATAQGNTVMVFTLATVLFLPLSFLSSLFALDVASFQKAPAWAFYVIFFVSIGISAFSWLAIRNLEEIKSWEVWEYFSGSFSDVKSPTAQKTRDWESSGTPATAKNTRASQATDKAASTGVEAKVGDESPQGIYVLAQRRHQGIFSRLRRGQRRIDHDGQQDGAV
ncbi:hypothetical protein FGRMN_2766 [Fusarium graminum]|nr:hypothetical protein FGRMN_2766 [Fusarium graminum]